MSKQEQRAEAERLMREAMERKGLAVKQGDTRIETKCGKCGAVNKVSAKVGESRVTYKCKECGHEQRAM
jgi:phage FluMu protein Com